MNQTLYKINKLYVYAHKNTKLFIVHHVQTKHVFNPLTPNDPYSGRTAPLTSKRCILYIYSTKIGTEYFKHGIYSPFFPSKCSLFHNSNVFGSCIIHILYTECAKIKKNHSGAKRLTTRAQKEELKVLKLSQTTVLVPRQNHYGHLSISTQHINFKLNLGKKFEKKHRR